MIARIDWRQPLCPPACAQDPLKWLMAYFLNEDGIRQGSIWETAFFQKGQRIGASAGIGVTKVGTRSAAGI